MELTVKVITPEKILFDGPAKAVATHNQQGRLSILPHHTNFISIVEHEIVIIKPDNTKFQSDVDRSVLFCRADQVQIYIGIKSTIVQEYSPVASPKPVSASF